MLCRLRSFVLFSIVLFVTFTNGYAQEFNDYIIGDSTAYVGRVALKGNKQLLYTAHKLDEGRIFKLNTVKEFSVKGVAFVPLQVDGRRVFYKRLSKGDLTIYKHARNVYLESGNGLVALKPGTFRTQLRASAVKCTSKDFSRVSRREKSLKAFANKYNNGHCDLESIDYSKIGFYSGFTLISLHGDLQYFSGKAQPSRSVSLGVFSDFSLSKHKVYLSSDLMFTKFSANFYKVDGQTQDYFGINARAVQLSSSVKLLLSERRLTTYIKGGVVVAHVNSHPGSTFIRSTGMSSVTITQVTFKSNSNSSVGLFPAFGVHLPITGRVNAHLEMRYNQSLWQLGSSTHTESADVTMSNLLVAAGINF